MIAPEFKKGDRVTTFGGGFGVVAGQHEDGLVCVDYVTPNDGHLHIWPGYLFKLEPGQIPPAYRHAWVQ